MRGFTCAASEKDDKRSNSRSTRRAVKQIIVSNTDDAWETAALSERRTGEPYLWAKDGCQRFDPVRSPELMRK